VAVISDPDRAKGDRHFLFAVCPRWGVNLPEHGGMDDPEPYLGSCGAWPVRRAGRTIIFGFVTP